jgi:hypothetical protein
MENKKCLSQFEISPAMKSAEHGVVDDTLLGKYSEKL